jgi:hypothetical protein
MNAVVALSAAPTTSKYVEIVEEFVDGVLADIL